MDRQFLHNAAGQSQYQPDRQEQQSFSQQADPRAQVQTSQHGGAQTVRQIYAPQSQQYWQQPAFFQASQRHPHIESLVAPVNSQASYQSTTTTTTRTEQSNNLTATTVPGHAVQYGM